MTIIEQLDRWISGLRSRVQSMVLKALISSVDDSGQIQLVKVSVLRGETNDKVERIQNYGLSSCPPEGGEAVVLSVGGNRDHLICIGADYGDGRMSGLEPGEVALYHKDSQHILLKADGTIEIDGNGNDINITGGTVNINNGNLTVDA